ELRANAGSQFDPTVVDVMTRTLDRPVPGGGNRFKRSAGGRRPQTGAATTELPRVPSDEGLIGLRPDGTIHSMNSAAVRLLGWSAEQAIGRQMPDLVHHSYPN